MGPRTISRLCKTIPSDKGEMSKFKKQIKILVFPLLVILIIAGCGVRPMIVYVGDGMQYLSQENLREVRDTLGGQCALSTRYYAPVVFTTIKIDSFGNGLYYATLRYTWHGSSPTLYPMAKCGDRIAFWGTSFTDRASELLQNCPCEDEMIEVAAKLDSIGPRYWKNIYELKAKWKD